MLGERLYPLVEKHESLHVAKLTGMLAVGDESSRYLAPDGVRRRTQVQSFFEALDVLRLFVDAPDHYDLGFSTTN